MHVRVCVCLFALLLRAEGWKAFRAVFFIAFRTKLYRLPSLVSLNMYFLFTVLAKSPKTNHFMSTILWFLNFFKNKFRALFLTKDLQTFAPLKIVEIAKE